MFEHSIRTHAADPAGPMRREPDARGELDIPAGTYWGVHTARALVTFAISGRPISDYPDLIGALDHEKARPIERACEEIRAGRLHDQFVVDVIPGGAGTSTNINANEIIANRALEFAGRGFGDYAYIVANDDVNRGQSTNDAYPTALKVALIRAGGRLVAELDRLVAAFRAKSEEFAVVRKVGRTQLQDAVPMTLGQEFAGFAAALGSERSPLTQLLRQLTTSNLGATAIGTGIATDATYAAAVRHHLSSLAGSSSRRRGNLVAATADMGAFMHVSGAVRTVAIKLSKFGNDLRLLASDPQFGLGQIDLPERQAGWSIMPGKVNPVIPEVVNQVCFSIAAADAVEATDSEAGTLQRNAFGPLVTHSLLQSEKWLTAALITLRKNRIDDITANRERLAKQTDAFVGVVTAFTPYIGYATAAAIAKRALSEGVPIAALLAEKRTGCGSDRRGARPRPVR